MERLTLIRPEDAQLAPEWKVGTWLNTDQRPTLASLRGRVVVLHAFQMLCPGCVSHGIPQTKRVRTLFSPEEVCVLGIHTVFEHHTAMTEVSLRAFLHEYRITFPVGVDMPRDNSHLPQTMASYEMRGTPSLLLLDRQGRLRLHVFGRPEDMAVGAAIRALVDERGPAHEAPGPTERFVPKDVGRCTSQGCEVMQRAGCR